MKEWLKTQFARLGLTTAAVEGVAPAADEVPVILIVDDNPTNLQVLVETLQPQGYSLLVARNGRAALSLARRSNPSLVLLDVMMPEMDGYEVCRRLKADADLEGVAVLFCSALDDTEAKVKGLQLGAVDFITKPFQPEEVVARVGTHLAVQRLASSLQVRNAALVHELEVARAHHEQALKRLEWALLGDSEPARKLRAEIEQQAQLDLPVLISGPTSCGDEAVARAIHAASGRRNGPFIAVDCSRLTPDEEAAIFEPKASMRSRMALAQEGTIYLEHVQHLTLAGQLRLRHLLENPSRVRIIACAWRGRPKAGDASPELFDTLERNALELPSLAERRDDIEALALDVLWREGRRLGKPTRKIAPDSLSRLKAHEWPGNLRELEDVIFRSLAASNDEYMHVDKTFLQVGKPIGGYRLLKRLASGGYGEVWTARHQLLARPAAIKLIKADKHDDETVERFRREAGATAQLKSPHTVTLFDFGIGDGGEFYYVMELLDGLDLEQILRQSGPIRPARLAALLVSACKSLAEAHAAGIVHRDLKPSNLFVCRLGLEEDFLKVLDFGLALRHGVAEARLTDKHSAVGTPDYMAPESVTGRGIDGRTDMYSLGAAAWHLLMGFPPFPKGTAVQKLMQHVSDAPPALAPQIPEPLAELVMRCLSKDPEARPTAAEMWRALEESDLPRRWTPQDAKAFWAARTATAP